MALKYEGMRPGEEMKTTGVKFDRSNIVLIGMPGAGKSTVGVLVAKNLGLAFIDSDLLIQGKEGRLLQEILNQDGVAEFLKIEERVILELQPEQSVIATGGSVVYSEAAMGHLKENSWLFYLKLSCSEIEQRINNMTSRGIAMVPGQSLADLYRERVPLYEEYADVTVDCANTTIEEVVTKITGIAKGM